jgi:hypothetical protein
MQSQTLDQVKLLTLGIAVAVAFPFLMQSRPSDEVHPAIQSAPREAECVSSAELALRPGAWLCEPRAK